MSVQSKPYYWLTCDEPECGNKSTDGDEFTAWADEDQAIMMAENSDWLILGDKHYCDGHANKHLKEDDDDGAN